MSAMALSRVAARAVESGPDGENLAPGAWQRLETLPDPRARGRLRVVRCRLPLPARICAYASVPCARPGGLAGLIAECGGTCMYDIRGII
jgi:hypothetical protein